jgi:hypothetical protein
VITHAAIGSMVSIATAVIGALVAILGALGYQNRRARMSAIRTVFSEVVTSLASNEARQQLAAAVLLRRFFDATSELGVRDWRGRTRLPYAEEALSVMAAVLRGLPAGDLQKLLADGLAYAPTLEGADLQRTNLQGAYLSGRWSDGTLERADFYRADLSGGSLKGARATNAVFYQARLRGTVFRDADLRGANFFEADLTGATFRDALLAGASFASARGVPAELEPCLDPTRRYTSAAAAPGPPANVARPMAVFISLPSSRSPAQSAAHARLEALLRHEGLAIERLPPIDYPPSDALSEIYRRISGCAGAVVFGMCLHPASADAASPGVTPWSHVEAGIAYGCNVPLLIVREPGVNAGVFADVVAGYHTYMLDLSDRWDDAAVLATIRPWLSDLAR